LSDAAAVGRRLLPRLSGTVHVFVLGRRGHDLQLQRRSLALLDGAMRLIRSALLAIALAAAACGSDVRDSDDLGAADLAVGDLASFDLVVTDCPPATSMGGPEGAGGTCAQPDEYCYYFESYCHCNVQSHSWYCCSDGQRRLCPVQPPSGPDCCQAYFASQCSYACTAGVTTLCNCTDDAWHCTTMPCD
jgi:hypothetical protein